MQSFRNILIILNKWKWAYLLSAILVTGSVLMRMIEPKILQVTIDTMAFLLGEVSTNIEQSDGAVQMLYRVLPDIETSKTTTIFISLGLVFFVITILRSLAAFAGGVLKSAATEKAIKQFRDKLFGHLQKLPVAYFDTNKTGEIIQRSTGDMDTVPIKYRCRVYSSFSCIWYCLLLHGHCTFQIGINLY